MFGVRRVSASLPPTRSRKASRWRNSGQSCSREKIWKSPSPTVRLPWGSDARGKAHVHVVIIGLDSRENVRTDKRLFSYPDIKGEPEETLHVALSPYMFDAGGMADPHLTVREESRPINRMGKLINRF